MAFNSSSNHTTERLAMTTTLTKRLGAPTVANVTEEIVPLKLAESLEITPNDPAAAVLEDSSKSGAGSLFPALAGLASYIGATSYRCWCVLIVSILIEIYATTLTKIATDSSDGKKLTLAMSMYIVSLLGFAACLPKIEVGVAYAVWSALGTAVVSIAGMVMFGERCDAVKFVSIAFIILGVVGLNLSDGGH